MSYNPADHPAKLQEMVNRSEHTYQVPPRWVSCMAAKILHQNQVIKQLQERISKMEQTLDEGHDYV